MWQQQNPSNLTNYQSKWNTLPDKTNNYNGYINKKQQQSVKNYQSDYQNENYSNNNNYNQSAQNFNYENDNYNNTAKSQQNYSDNQPSQNFNNNQHQNPQKFNNFQQNSYNNQKDWPDQQNSQYSNQHSTPQQPKPTTQDQHPQEYSFTNPYNQPQKSPEIRSRVESTNQNSTHSSDEPNVITDKPSIPEDEKSETKSSKMSKQPYGVPINMIMDWEKERAIEESNIVTQKFKIGSKMQEIHTRIINEHWLGVDLYPLTSYNFGTKDAVYDNDNKSLSDFKNFTNLKIDFKKKGMRRTVFGVLLVHEHNLPHLLLLQDSKGSDFCLPGGILEYNEKYDVGLRRHLKKILGKKSNSATAPDPSQRGIEKDEWIIKDHIGQWIRPNFDQKQYCYKPAHVTKPKETTKLYLIQLPPKALFAVPKNYKLVAAPLHEVYDNTNVYGHMIGNIPHMISRYNLNLKKDMEGMK